MYYSKNCMNDINNKIIFYCYSVDDEWKGLTNALAGLFCASLNFINPANSMSPEFTFRPTGVVDHSINSSHLRYSSLPKEIVCTENLTPFKKLLPCDSKVYVKNRDLYLFCVTDTDIYDVLIERLGNLIKLCLYSQHKLSFHWSTFSSYMLKHNLH